MLRLLDPARDGPSLHAVFGDPACCRYMLDDATSSVEETVRVLTDWTKGTEDTSWAIVESEDGPALGRVTLIPRGPGVWEAGITLSPAAQGRGLAYGAMAQVSSRISILTTPLPYGCSSASGFSMKGACAPSGSPILGCAIRS